jgi:hypothetical protein
VRKRVMKKTYLRRRSGSPLERAFASLLLPPPPSELVFARIDFVFSDVEVTWPAALE